MMDVLFNMHESLTAAGNFYNISIVTEFFLAHFQYYVACNQNFALVIIYSFHSFSIVPLERFHMQQMFLIL